MAIGRYLCFPDKIIVKLYIVIQIAFETSKFRLIMIFPLWQPRLVAVSNAIRFANPNAPVYPCVSQGKAWTEGEQGILKGIICRRRLRQSAPERDVGNSLMLLHKMNVVEFMFNLFFWSSKFRWQQFIVNIFFLIFPQMTVTWTSGYNINEAEPVGKINTWIQIKKKNTCMHSNLKRQIWRQITKVKCLILLTKSLGLVQ